MNDINILTKMYFIVDTQGHFFRVSSDGELVMAKDRSDAGIFSFDEANGHIGTGMKAKFYSVIPADTEVRKKGSTLTEKYNPVFKDMDWKEYLNKFCDITSSINEYRKWLNDEQREADMKICDLLHYVELYELDDNQRLQTIDQLREVRDHRRFVKNEIEKIECFQNSIGNDVNLFKAREAADILEKFEERIYHPRVLTDLFEGAVLRDKEMEYDAYVAESAEDDGYFPEEEQMDYERIATPYDDIKMDWKTVAEQQLTFFRNAGQHIINLEIDIRNIDDELEALLESIEDARCNITQGYKMFKKIQDLRVLRREKEKELESVKAIEKCFDCSSMADAYEYCIGEIEDIMGTGNIADEGSIEGTAAEDTEAGDTEESDGTLENVAV